ncbi:MAG: coproporphyrinogen III oxidase [Myxococcales bacterium]|nr:coproporphyrinogen III oxidase [Myxococcales bacterium]
MVPASSTRAVDSLRLVEALKLRFVLGLEGLSADFGERIALQNHTWLRDEGQHGGGHRACIADTQLYGRASVNVSQVHYDDLPDKRLKSATALSTIIHPVPPRLPSVHIHVSYTEIRDEAGYWRIMADLNPSIPRPEDTAWFAEEIQKASGAWYEEGTLQGDKYFYIPALERHRGVNHFYLEGLNSGEFIQDYTLAESIGRAAIDAYLTILRRCLDRRLPVTEEAILEQLGYHTVYFFQVLMLDRGTTSGLLVHDQNDVGILGSLPRAVDRELLMSWRSRLVEPQVRLLDQLVAALPNTRPAVVGEQEKRALAEVVREHFRAHPEALKEQASGFSLPATVANHGKQ